VGLANALRKISGGAKTSEMPSAESNPATAHMFIVNPLTGRGTDNLFSTHPDVNNRIEALMKMAGTPDMAAPQVRASSVPNIRRTR